MDQVFPGHRGRKRQYDLSREFRSLSGSAYQNVTSASRVHAPAIQAPGLPITLSKMTTATPARAVPSNMVPTVAYL